MIKFMEVNTMNIFKKTNNKETKETLKRGISEKSGMPQICKGGASI